MSIVNLEAILTDFPERPVLQGIHVDSGEIPVTRLLMVEAPTLAIPALSAMDPEVFKMNQSAARRRESSRRWNPLWVFASKLLAWWGQFLRTFFFDILPIPCGICILVPFHCWQLNLIVWITRYLLSFCHTRYNAGASWRLDSIMCGVIGVMIIGEEDSTCHLVLRNKREPNKMIDCPYPANIIDR